MYVNESDFTHKASFYGVPCYFNLESGMLVGRSALWDRLIPLATWIHNYLVARFYSNGFPIRLISEIDQKNVCNGSLSAMRAACGTGHLHQSSSTGTGLPPEHPDESV